jgi:hypothetical protein
MASEKQKDQALKSIRELVNDQVIGPEKLTMFNVFKAMLLAYDEQYKGDAGIKNAMYYVWLYYVGIR